MTTKSEIEDVWKKIQVLQDSIVDDCERMNISPNDAAFALVDMLAVMAVQKLVHRREKIVLLLDHRIAVREKQIAKIG